MSMARRESPSFACKTLHIIQKVVKYSMVVFVLLVKKDS